MSKKKNTESKVVSAITYALSSIFLCPYAVMLGVGTLGWGWSYWKAMLIENAATVPLSYTITGALFIAAKRIQREL